MMSDSKYVTTSASKGANAPESTRGSDRVKAPVAAASPIDSEGGKNHGSSFDKDKELIVLVPDVRQQQQQQEAVLDRYRRGRVATLTTSIEKAQGAGDSFKANLFALSLKKEMEKWSKDDANMKEIKVKLEMDYERKKREERNSRKDKDKVV
ncbi:hypothetical protein TKK_0016666 [Trichogramma kaykai]|uniref:No apical meristem-associated C-terminal domain-containing protein n=1 Tax=Trichogramma kaykai TaxID=54128 RepID=A0ABD2W665_9HYME